VTIAHGYNVSFKHKRKNKAAKNIEKYSASQKSSHPITFSDIFTFGEPV